MENEEKVIEEVSDEETLNEENAALEAGIVASL